MTQKIMREGININTLLLTIVLALSGWTLKKVSEQGEIVAAMNARIVNLERVVYVRSP